MKYMVIDVESVGLHGEGFAVGYVVIDDGGKEYDAGWWATDPVYARGTALGLKWVRENVPDMTYEVHNTYTLRARFWERWQHWKGEGALLAADCAWPVEARFLAACVDDQPSVREWQGPYPLVDVASIRLAAGFDPLGNYPRLPDEPQHHPLGDAKQSARLLMVALAKLRGESREPVETGVSRV